MNAAVRFPIQPRLISPAKTARRLGVTEPEFAARRDELFAAGFPKPDPIFGNFCLEAVDKWIDASAGLTRADDPVSAQAAMLRAVREKVWAK